MSALTGLPGARSGAEGTITAEADMTDGGRVHLADGVRIGISDTSRLAVVDLGM